MTTMDVTENIEADARDALREMDPDHPAFDTVKAIKNRAMRTPPEGEHAVILDGTDWVRVAIALGKQADDEDVSEDEREQFDRLVEAVKDQAGPLMPYMMELDAQFRARRQRRESP